MNLEHNVFSFSLFPVICLVGFFFVVGESHVIFLIIIQKNNLTFTL